MFDLFFLELLKHQIIVLVNYFTFFHFFDSLTMRKSRNADVVTSSHHSDEEEELEDSEDDWQPEKVSFLFNKPIMMN